MTRPLGKSDLIETASHDRLPKATGFAKG
jgi:hypothetical protein